MGQENPQAATLDLDYAAGKKAIEARDYGRAIESQLQRPDAPHEREQDAGIRAY